MARATNTPARLARKRRLLKAAKGFRGNRSKLYRVMKETVHRAWAYGYRGRRRKKRDFRALWTVRVNAAARARDIPYSRLAAGLKRAGIELNRKVLSEIAIQDPKAFDAVVEVARASAPGAVAAASS
jgi:large subunit ribosomal protein L20